MPYLFTLNAFIASFCLFYFEGLTAANLVSAAPTRIVKLPPFFALSFAFHKPIVNVKRMRYLSTKSKERKKPRHPTHLDSVIIAFTALVPLCVT